MTHNADIAPRRWEVRPVNAKHSVRQRARCRACIRTANGWTCRTCGSAYPHHPSPCPYTPEGDR